MKTLLKTSILTLAFIAIVSCKEKQTVEINTPEEVKAAKKKTADIADQGFIDGMTGKVWHNYLEIKMALVRGDAAKAKSISKDMAASFEEERMEMKMHYLKEPYTKNSAQWHLTMKVPIGMPMLKK